MKNLGAKKGKNIVSLIFCRGKLLNFGNVFQDSRSLCQAIFLGKMSSKPTKFHHPDLRPGGCASPCCIPLLLLVHAPRSLEKIEILVYLTFCLVQDGPILVINGVVTPINNLLNG